MNNHITASVEFYFRGNKISSTVELDIDNHMQSAGKLPDLYPLLARAANLDLYSYEYEMMQTEMITFSLAKGLVAEFVSGDFLDIDTFETAWAEYDILAKLEKVAQKNLSIEDLTEHTDLKNALIEAYQLGEQAR